MNSKILIKQMFKIAQKQQLIINRLAQRLESKLLPSGEDPDTIDPDTVDPLFSGYDPNDPNDPNEGLSMSDYEDTPSLFYQDEEFVGLHDYIKNNMPPNLSPLDKDKWYKDLQSKIQDVRNNIKTRSRPHAKHL